MGKRAHSTECLLHWEGVWTPQAIQVASQRSRYQLLIQLLEVQLMLWCNEGLQAVRAAWWQDSAFLTITVCLLSSLHRKKIGPQFICKSVPIVPK